MRIASTVLGALVVTSLVGTSAQAAPAPTGPSSSAGPYVLTSSPGVVTKSILSVGDQADNGYRMVGKPDGLGAFDNGDGTFTLLMDQELPATAGVERDHGSIGAFISRWTIDSESLRVLAGDDLIKRVLTPTGTGWAPAVLPLNRLCSADLPGFGAFYDPESGRGTLARIFLSGEEAGMGRQFAHVVDGADAGSSYQLTGLSRADWENAVTMPGTGAATVVVETNDDMSGQVYVYVGEKKVSGNDVERAGLTGGTLYGVKIEGVGQEGEDTTVPAGGNPFSLVEIPGAATMNRNQLENASNALGVSRLNRPEDAVFSTVENRTLYVAATASFASTSRLWQLDFKDPKNVLDGGQASIALSSPPYDETNPAGPRMMDNLTVNSRGQVLIQEDPGDQAYLAGIFQFDPRTGGVKRVAQHDSAKFLAGSEYFLTQSEESSGIIPAPFLGEGKYLLTEMAHYPTGDIETFEGGQLLVMHVPPGKPVR